MHNFINDDVKNIVYDQSGDVAVWDQPYHIDELWEYVPSINNFKYLIVLSDSRRIAKAILSANDKNWIFVREFIMDLRSCYRAIDGVLDSHKTVLLFSNGQQKLSTSKYRGKEFHSCVHVKKSGSHAHSKSIDFFVSLFGMFNCYTLVDFFTGSGSITIAGILSGMECTTIDINKTCGIVLKERLNKSGLAIGQKE